MTVSRLGDLFRRRKHQKINIPKAAKKIPPPTPMPAIAPAPKPPSGCAEDGPLFAGGGNVNVIVVVLVLFVVVVLFLLYNVENTVAVMATIAGAAV